jgi:hypothetical protein
MLPWLVDPLGAAIGIVPSIVCAPAAALTNMKASAASECLSIGILGGGGGCLRVIVLHSRSVDSATFPPLKPVGVTNLSLIVH